MKFVCFLAIIVISSISVNFVSASTLSSLSSSSACGAVCRSNFCGITGVFPSSSDCDFLSQLESLIQASTDSICYQKLSNGICSYFQANADHFSANQCNNTQRLPICLQDCQQYASCTFDPVKSRVLPLCNLISQPGNCTIDYPMNNYTVPIPHRECVGTSDLVPSVDPNIYAISQMSLYGVLSTSNPQLHLPQPNLVYLPDRSLASIFPSQCKNLSLVTNDLWRADLYWAFLALTFACQIWFIIRRKHQPLRSRNIMLTLLSSLMIGTSYFTLLFSVLFGVTAPCVMRLMTGLYIIPCATFIPLLSGCRLLFLYKWSQSKLKRTAKSARDDWYFDHKYMLTTPFFALCIFIQNIFSTIVFLPIYYSANDLRVGLSALETGRCWWYEITPSIYSHAASQGVGMGPIPANPNGWLPVNGEVNGYMPNFGSCTFCTLADWMVTVIVVYSMFFVVLLMVCVWYLRNLNDQFGLWRESMLNCIMLIVVIPSAVPVYYRSVTAYEYTVNNHIIEVAPLIQTVGCIFFQVVTLLYPILSSYKREYKSRGGGSRSRSRERMSGNNKSINRSSIMEREHNAFKLPSGDRLSIDELLERSELLEAFRIFSVECFAVENIEFFVAASQWKHMEDKEEEAHFIYENFIKNDSPLQVNISGPEQRSLIANFENRLNQIKTGAPRDPFIGNEFDSSIKTIRHLMLINTWPKFLNSSMFKQLQEQGALSPTQRPITPHNASHLRDSLGGKHVLSTGSVSHLSVPHNPNNINNSNNNNSNNNNNNHVGTGSGSGTSIGTGSGTGIGIGVGTGTSVGIGTVSSSVNSSPLLGSSSLIDRDPQLLMNQLRMSYRSSVTSNFNPTYSPKRYIHRANIPEGDEQVIVDAPLQTPHLPRPHTHTKNISIEDVDPQQVVVRVRNHDGDVDTAQEATGVVFEGLLEDRDVQVQVQQLELTQHRLSPLALGNQHSTTSSTTSAADANRYVSLDSDSNQDKLLETTSAQTTRSSTDSNE